MDEVELCPICLQPWPAEPLPAPPPAVAVEPPAPVETEPATPVPLTAVQPGWGEVAAVLAVGVVPNLYTAVLYRVRPVPPRPFWEDVLSLSVTTALTTFVTLYLISRSGEPWERFGIVRPRLTDLLYAGGMALWAVSIARLVPYSWYDDGPTHDPFPHPESGLDLWLLAVGQVSSALSEEIVTRAYLIKRLSILLRSRAEAILVAAALFASYHLYGGFGHVVYTFLFGCAYGLAFLFLRRVWPLALGHATYNVLLELSAR